MTGVSEAAESMNVTSKMNQSRKRVVLWIDEINDDFLAALREADVEVAAVIQASHPAVPSFSVHDLYYGSAALFALPAVSAPAAWIDDSSFRQYARCVQRVGFHPASDFMESGSGGVMLGPDIEDWARVHLNHCVRLLSGVAADEVWFSFNPHLGLDNMLALAAHRTDRACLVFSQIRFAAKFSWKRLGATSSTVDTGLTWLPWEGGATQPNLFYMREFDTAPWHMDIGPRLRFLFRRLLKGDWSALSSRMYLAARSRRWWSVMAVLEMLDQRTRPWAFQRRYFKRRFDARQASSRQFIQEQDWGDFIYFPLHLEPEENVHAIGGDYRNQLDAVVALHDQLHEGWKILLKENPKQSFQHRGEPFDARIAGLANVHFVETSVPSKRLMERARLVATITGTAGYEALLMGHACLYFGEAWFAGLPGAVAFYPGINLLALSQQRVQADELDRAVNVLLGGLADGLAHPRFAGVHPPEHLPALYRQAALSMCSISDSYGTGHGGFRWRRARAGESEVAYRIKRAACVVQVESIGPWLDEEQWPAHQRRFSTQTYLLGEIDGRAVAVMALSNAPDSVRLNQLFVLPEFQGQGIGVTAYENALSEGRSRALPVRLNVRKVNWRTVALVKRMGFVEVGQTEIDFNFEAPVVLPHPAR